MHLDAPLAAAVAHAQRDRLALPQAVGQAEDVELLAAGQAQRLPRSGRA